ncbi:MAG: histidine kinase [Algibacter sp.]
MKKSFYFLLFLGINAFAQEAENLPDALWEEIIEIDNNEYSDIRQWNTDINVKLEGNYTIQDSLRVANVITKLDSLTEVISIQFSKNEKSNFKIIFLDSIRYASNNKGNNWLHGRGSVNPNKQRKSELYVYNAKTTKPKFRNSYSIEARITKELIGGYFAISRDRELIRNHKRESIFNPIEYPNTLKNEDLAIVKEVYTLLFFANLESAKNKYKYVFDEIDDQQIESRNRNLWWVKNPISIIFLPTLILLLLFLFIIKKIKAHIASVIKNDGLFFIAMTFIALLFLDIIIVFFVSFYDFLITPPNYGYNLIRYDTVATTTFSLLLSLFPITVFRMIELKIQKTKKSIFTKTTLIFLSTGFLPFLIVLSLFVIIQYVKSDGELEYLILSKLFLFFMSIASARALIAYFFFKERNIIVDNEKKLSNLRELKAKAELKSLHAHINPHFLYNALNSIASLAPSDSEKTQKMAYSLSNLFKYAIDRKDNKMSSIKDEITMVENYLDIEKIRFGDRLKFRVNVDETLENIEIPMFIIQPLVENAVKHGLSKIEGQGDIELKIKKTKTGLLIAVSDNGPDFPEGLVSGHGLQTVYDLLDLSYGARASLNWQNTPHKSITINITQNSLNK